MVFDAGVGNALMVLSALKCELLVIAVLLLADQLCDELLTLQLGSVMKVTLHISPVSVFHALPMAREEVANRFLDSNVKA